MACLLFFQLGLSFLLTGGNAHDCPLAEDVIRRTKAAKKLLGDKAYDSAPLRHWLDERGTKAVIPNKCNRKQPFTFNRTAYRLRHRIENAFCRLKDFRRIATRYDRLVLDWMRLYRLLFYPKQIPALSILAG